MLKILQVNWKIFWVSELTSFNIPGSRKLVRYCHSWLFWHSFKVRWSQLSFMNFLYPFSRLVPALAHDQTKIQNQVQYHKMAITILWVVSHVLLFMVKSKPTARVRVNERRHCQRTWYTVVRKITVTRKSDILQEVTNKFSLNEQRAIRNRFIHGIIG